MVLFTIIQIIISSIIGWFIGRAIWKIYYHKRYTLNMLAKNADTEDDIVILYVIEFKEDDYYTFNF